MKKVMDHDSMHRAITRIGHEIVERNHGTESVVLVGIRTRGLFIAERLRVQIRAIEDVELPLGALDITLYRDDLQEIGPNPDVKETHLPFDVTDKIVILIDDVLYTGRTIRSALDAIMDFGRPRAIQLAVLIDRGHRELPIKADYVGKNIPTSSEEVVLVKMMEKDGEDEVLVIERKDL